MSLDHSYAREKPCISPHKDSGAKRRHFRHHWKPKRPPHVIRVDEAIDRIGRYMFPDRWGTQPDFDKLPIFSTGLGLVRLEPTRGAGYRKVSIEKTPSIVAIRRDFQQVCEAIEEAVRKDQVRVTFVTSEGRQRALRKELMYVQRIPLFGAGFVKIDSKKCRVWINRLSFKEWFSAYLYPKVKIEQDRIAIFEEVISKFIATPSSQLNARSHQFSRAEIIDLLRTWTRTTPTPASVDDLMDVVPASARRGGRPLGKTKWEPIKHKIVDLLRRRHSQSIAVASKPR